jgi:dTDP-4-dehydrorhamnose 3,5-epimerase
MIEDVKIIDLRLIPDERGYLMEILRSDDEHFTEFGQAYITTAYPDVVKAWHYHKDQTDSIACIKGMAKLVLYDSRENSPTYGEVNELFVGTKNPRLVVIPPLVYHGFKAVGGEMCIVVNVPDKTYDYDNPDEHRVDPYDNDIPYDWDIREG